MDPFAAALDALFSLPPAQDAIYTPRGAAPRPAPVRIIVGQPDETSPFGEGRTITAEIQIEIRMHEIPEPGAGDRLDTATGAYVLDGEPMSDLEGMTWRIAASEVPVAV